MPLWVAAILGGFIQAAGTLVGRVLVSLGIGYVTFTGVDSGITFARDSLIASIGQLPATAIQVAATMKIGTAVSIITSALLARMVLQGLTSGSVSRFVNKG